MMRRDRPWDEHEEQALRLGRSEDPIGHHLDRGGLSQREAAQFRAFTAANPDVFAAIARQRRRRWWMRTLRTFGWLALVLAAAALLIIGSWS